MYLNVSDFKSEVLYSVLCFWPECVELDRDAAGC